MAYTLPPLPYPNNALEPNIDAARRWRSITTNTTMPT
jgi:hypothetical protein